MTPPLCRHCHSPMKAFEYRKGGKVEIIWVCPKGCK